jgi:hypothetical protein
MQEMPRLNLGEKGWYHRRVEQAVICSLSPCPDIGGVDF